MKKTIGDTKVKHISLLILKISFLTLFWCGVQIHRINPIFGYRVKITLNINHINSNFSWTPGIVLIFVIVGCSIKLLEYYNFWKSLYCIIVFILNNIIVLIVGEFGQRNKTLPLIRVDKTHSGVYTCTVSGKSCIEDSLMIIALFTQDWCLLSNARFIIPPLI